eukprot:409119-Pyramimonas_sp.AAC.1
MVKHGPPGFSLSVLFARSSGFGPPEPTSKTLEPLDRAKIIEKNSWGGPCVTICVIARTYGNRVKPEIPRS